MLQYWLIYAPRLLGNLFDLAHRLRGCRKRADPRATRASRGGRFSQYQFGFPPTFRMDALELCCAPTVDDFRLTADLRCAARLQRRRPPPCRQCESEYYLDWSLDVVGTDQRREYSNRPAVERTGKSGVLGRPAPSKPSRARIRRFAANRCCLDLSRSLRSSGSKHRKAPCRGARSALFGSTRSQGVVCRERNDTGRGDGLVAGARIWRREIRLRAGSAFFPTNIVGRE